MSSAPPPLPAGKPPGPSGPLPRGYQRKLPPREKTLKDWLVALPALAVTAYIFAGLVRLGRGHPAVAYGFVALALLALAFDVYMLLRGHSMVLVIGVIFGAAAVVSLVPVLAAGIPHAVVAAAAYVGFMLLIAFRKRA